MLLQVAWLTPCEIFTPLYGQAVAKYLLADCNRHARNRIDILEIGGGTGILAKDILDCIKQASFPKKPLKLYSNSR